MTGPFEVDENSLCIAKEALRQTEIRLEDINNLATSADHRAMSFSATLAAVALLLTTFAQQVPNPMVAYIASSGFVLSTFFAVASSMPRTFHVRGHFWTDWRGHITDGDSYYEAICAQARENDDRLFQNDVTLRASAFKINWAFRIAVWSSCFFLGAQIRSMLVISNTF